MGTSGARLRAALSGFCNQTGAGAGTAAAIACNGGKVASVAAATACARCSPPRQQASTFAEVAAPSVFAQQLILARALSHPTHTVVSDGASPMRSAKAVITAARLERTDPSCPPADPLSNGVRREGCRP